MIFLLVMGFCAKTFVIVIPEENIFALNELINNFIPYKHDGVTYEFSYIKKQKSIDWKTDGNET